MDEPTFRQKLYHASVMEEIHNGPDYWRGYARGVQRAFYGGAFGTEEEHQGWLALADSDEFHDQERGVGYRHGLNTRESN